MDLENADCVTLSCIFVEAIDMLKTMVSCTRNDNLATLAKSQMGSFAHVFVDAFYTYLFATSKWEMFSKPSQMGWVSRARKGTKYNFSPSGLMSEMCKRYNTSFNIQPWTVSWRSVFLHRVFNTVL